jgi:hypothetical protein
MKRCSDLLKTTHGTFLNSAAVKFLCNDKITVHCFHKERGAIPSPQGKSSPLDHPEGRLWWRSLAFLPAQNTREDLHH